MQHLTGGGGAGGAHTAGISSGSGTFFLQCNICGGPLNGCGCQPSTTIIPNIFPGTLNPNPNIFPGVTWTGTGIDTSTLYSFLKVLDVETKERYDHSGFFKVERNNEKDGIYGGLSGLVLPTIYKEAFALIRSEEYFKLWQIRSPLTYQIDFQIDANKDESHFFTLVSVKDVEAGENKLILTEPRFQEIPSPIDLCQLIEIQRVFTKLLRRI